MIIYNYQTLNGKKLIMGKFKFIIFYGILFLYFSLNSLLGLVELILNYTTSVYIFPSTIIENGFLLISSTSNFVIDIFVNKLLKAF